MTELVLPVGAGPTLVTGGTGFVGRALVEALARAGSPVRVLARKPLPTDFPGGALVQHALGDILDVESLQRALAGASAVVHSAGVRTGEAVADVMWRTNVEGTRLLAQAAKRAGVDRLVHISSASVYGHTHSGAVFRENDSTVPESAYGYSKLESERVLLAELMDTPVAFSILRPYVIYGARRVEFFREVQRRRVWLYAPARVITHPTHVEDVVRATLALLTHAKQPGVLGEIFNVAGERAVEHFEYVKLVAAELGVAPRRLALPGWLGDSLQPLAALGGPLGRLVNHDVLRAADTSKLRARVDWQPQPLQAGIAAAIRQARASGLL